jgi:hypothetical protein
MRHFGEWSICSGDDVSWKLWRIPWDGVGPAAVECHHHRAIFMASERDSNRAFLHTLPTTTISIIDNNNKLLPLSHAVVAEVGLIVLFGSVMGSGLWLD